MIERRAPWAVPVLLLLFSVFSGLVWADAEAQADETFPSYESIAGSVDFWVRVFSEWDDGQVVFHDARNPALIYEVVDLPGETGDRCTAQQKALTEDARRRWEGYLTTLERKIARAEPLSDTDKQWAVRIGTL